MVHDNTEAGYRVLVRAVSGSIVLACVILAGLVYIRVSIAQTYFPDKSMSSDLLRMVLVFSVLTFFTLSFWRGKFVWFWPANSPGKEK